MDTCQPTVIEMRTIILLALEIQIKTYASIL